ncbi:MAG TPA: glycosyltransferase [Candidatus Paceibacterota bacterium]|nr:glycosyltransferase [Candidatus Paceibacterota bacterium]
MTTPLLSVITTTYNCEKYIEESLNSILTLENKFRDFEIIIVDDGSTDNTSDLVHSFWEKNRSKIYFIRNFENKRIPTRRNEAISISRGRYVTIQDGDDVSFLDKFEKQIDFLENNPDIFCVGGHAIVINENGEFSNKKMDYPPESHGDIVNMITKKCMNPIIDPTTMFRRDIFNKLGKYTLDKSIYTVPDFDLWLRAILNGYKVHNLQDNLIKYRVIEDFGMTREHKKEMIEQHMIVWKKFMRQWKIKEKNN